MKMHLEQLNHNKTMKISSSSGICKTTNLNDSYCYFGPDLAKFWDIIWVTIATWK